MYAVLGSGIRITGDTSDPEIAATMSCISLSEAFPNAR
jgi:hypothetical protein